MADRSPNYPAYNLGEALEFALKLYGKEGTSATPTAVVATNLGYSSLSGAARQKIASMRQYGLIEEGQQGKVRVAPRVVQIKHDPDSAVSYKLLQEAALAPPLFQELREKHPDASDRNLEVVLINEKGFIPEGARRVLKSYRATLDFAKIGAQGYTEGDEAEIEDDLAGEQPENHSRDARRQGESETVTYSWPLDDGEKVEVKFIGTAGKPTKRDLEAVIDYLELVRKRTPDVPRQDGE